MTDNNQNSNQKENNNDTLYSDWKQPECWKGTPYYKTPLSSGPTIRPKGTFRTSIFYKVISGSITSEELEGYLFYHGCSKENNINNNIDTNPKTN